MTIRSHNTLRPVLAACAIGAGAATAAYAADGSAKKPHIILIMTDQQRADALGCAGNDAIITPHLDSLAAQGHLFTNAYTAAPSSTPARAGLLTGMTPWHHGLLGYARDIAPEYPVEMPAMLAANGYRTLGIGKMHWHPQRSLRGFEATLLDESGRREDPYFVSDYRKWFATEAMGLNPDSTGLGWNDHGAAPYALPERLHPTVWTADRAVEAIRGYSSDSPFFLKVSFARPHSPYDAPQRLIDMYDGVDIPAPVVGQWCGDVPLDTDPDAKPSSARGNFGADYAHASRRNYYAAVTFIDEQVGRIVAELKAKNMYDDALICFVSDHGDMLGDHHMWRKTYPYEGSAAIPFIVKLPAGMETGAVAPGTPIEAPVELRDLLPTFLEACGDTVPEAVDGMSLLPLMRSEGAPWRKYIDSQHSSCYWANYDWNMLTDGKLKYIWFSQTGDEQLFDLTADPGETRNLAADSNYASAMTEMRRAMADYLAERGEQWVDSDGKLVTHSRTILYSPHFPSSKSPR